MSEEQRKYLLIIVALIVGAILLWVGTVISLPKYDLEFRLSLIITGSVVLLVTFIVVIVQFCYPKICRSNPVTPEGSAPPVLDWIEAKTLRNIVIGAGVLVMGTFGWAGTYIILRGQESEIALPIVIIAGVTILLLVLGLLTVVFSMLKLSNREEALGLPSGSVRAVIALMLLVIFAIVAIFLYSDVSSGGAVKRIDQVTAEQEIELKKNLDVVSVVPDAKNAKDVKYPVTIFYRSATRAAEDLAKQLIVLLGTLVTAVSSFYFGSSSVAAATKPPTNIGGPNAKAVTPRNLKPETASQPLKITGTNLGNAASVKLIFDKEEITADAVVAGDTSVDCTVTTKSGDKPGPWTVVVSDNANNDSRIPGSVTIDPKATDAAPVALQTANPEITEIDDSSLKADGQERSVKVSGKNLADVEAVKFVPAIGITVVNVTPHSSGNALTFDVKIENATPPDREVSLLNKAGAESKPVKVTLAI